MGTLGTYGPIGVRPASLVNPRTRWRSESKSESNSRNGSRKNLQRSKQGSVPHFRSLPVIRSQSNWSYQMLDVIRRPCLVFIVWMTYSTLAICSASASPAVYECRPIHAAVHAGDLKRVKEILDKDPKQIDAQVEFRHFSFGTKKVDDTPL